MKLSMHLPHWHLLHPHIPHLDQSEEEVVVPFLILGLSIAVVTVVGIYLYSATV